MINFISNLPPELRTGGFPAMNVAAYETASQLDTIRYVGPVNPTAVLREKIASKFFRVLGIQRNFFAFSPARLKAIADEVKQRSSARALLDFFHGFTPWIMTNPERPYIAWSDCTFADYMNFYHRRQEFSSSDLERIEQMEAAWLRAARSVGFSSNWAAERAISHYALESSRVHVVGNFGEIDLLPRDEYAGGKIFVFVSTNFSAKGGATVLSAFRRLRQHCADASLIIVGARPRGGLNEPGVTLAGYLRKEVPDEHARFREILATARAIVHPTLSDISPLVLIEAGYFGCPAISSRMFAIPELIDDRRTGLLLDEPSNSAAVEAAMRWMLDDEIRYRRMRLAAWAKARAEHSRPKFSARLRKVICEAIAASTSIQAQ